MHVKEGEPGARAFYMIVQTVFLACTLIVFSIFVHSLVSN